MDLTNPTNDQLGEASSVTVGVKEDNRSFPGNEIPTCSTLGGGGCTGGQDDDGVEAAEGSGGEETSDSRMMNYNPSYPVSPNGYVVLDVIGNGMHKAVCIRNAEIVAIKIIDLNIPRTSLASLLLEVPVNILSRFANGSEYWFVLPSSSFGDIEDEERESRVQRLLEGGINFLWSHKCKIATIAFSSFALSKGYVKYNTITKSIKIWRTDLDKWREENPIKTKAIEMLVDRVMKKMGI